MSSIQSDSGQDFDLNIAPIIDCFTVLITYLLVSASFLSLSVLDVGVAASGEMAPPPTVNEKPPEPPLSLSIMMKQQGSFDIKLQGGPGNIDITIPVVTEGALQNQLTDVLRRNPGLKEANIAAEPTVRYKDMIKLIENLKKMIPKVFIAGT